MLNILHVISKLDVGGAENLVLSYVKNIDHSTFTATLCCISHAGKMAPEFEKLGVQIISLGLMKKKGWDSDIIRSLEEVIKNNSIDIVHTHLYHANIYGSLAASRCRIPSFMSIQNTYSHHKLHRRILNWYVSKRVKKVIVGSDDIKNDVVKYDWIRENKIEVINNCIDLDKASANVSRAQVRDELSLPYDAVVLGTIGRLEEQKGHSFLIRALSRMSDSSNNFYLILIGEGKKKQELQALVDELSLQEKVLFLGTRSDIGNLLAAMDIFIMPSLWEGLSLAMLTAMAAEIPVIATDVGGVRKVLGEDEYGLVIAPGEPDSIVTAIESVLNDKASSQQRVADAKRLVYEKYSDHAMVKKIEKLYLS